MEFEVSYSLDSAQQFWDELDDIVSAPCGTDELIDNALRSYLHLITTFKDSYVHSEDDFATCTYKLLESPLFGDHQEYVRRQMVYGLLQEDEAPTLHLMSGILLYDGRAHEQTFEMMQQEGAFARLIELIQGWSDDGALQRMLLELLYEMSRMQRLTWDDLTAIDDVFIHSLFRITESLSSDASDPYHYPIIRVLLVLNEQYMVTATLAHPGSSPPTNRVIKALSVHGNSYKTFGENLILLLNRESETSLQLLILKLLYLVFNSPATAEYFYTNDLHVLLDVILRNLLDLPNEEGSALALRHTYLRVLFPLLSNSQLRRAGMAYKRDEVRKLLWVLRGGRDENDEEDENPDPSSPSSERSKRYDAWRHHFAPVDETTQRLVKRCAGVKWLRDTEEERAARRRWRGSGSTEAESTPVDSPITPGEGQKDIAKRLLGITLKDEMGSALSVLEVAAQTEKPGVKSPSKSKGDVV